MFASNILLKHTIKIVKTNNKLFKLISKAQLLPIILRNSFHSSPRLRWTTPEELSTSELRRECDRRSIGTKGSRSALILRLKSYLTDAQGYDNGLTLDVNLSLKKKQIESEVNRIPDKHHSTQYIYVEERFQKKISTQFEGMIY